MLTDEQIKAAFKDADCMTWYDMYPSAARDVARALLAHHTEAQPQGVTDAMQPTLWAIWPPKSDAWLHTHSETLAGLAKKSGWGVIGYARIDVLDLGEGIDRAKGGSDGTK